MSGDAKSKFTAGTDASYMMPSNQQPTCAFPAPRPRMVYCNPAAFQTVDGQRYQKITYAYGHARPYGA